LVAGSADARPVDEACQDHADGGGKGDERIKRLLLGMGRRQVGRWQPFAEKRLAGIEKDVLLGGRKRSKKIA